MKNFEKAYLRVPKCPRCGEDLTSKEVFDTNSYENGTYVDTCMGFCVKCKISYFWDEIFTFSSRTKVKPVTI